ncbi:insulinase family protein [bacterium]|nr:insulinase family protein [bacterium]
MQKIEKLANGLTLLRVPMAGVESVTSVVMVGAGSRYEQSEDWGVAHFLEHMVFKGTKKYPNNKILSETVDGVGAVFNAFTSEEMTAFYLRSAASDLDLMLDVLSQLTTQALIETEEINRERGVILEEKHMYEDVPSSFNAQEFNKMVYAGSGLGHDIVGTQKSITNITRKNFLRFINEWYRPENMLIVVAGKASKVNDKNLSKKIERLWQFGKFSGKVGEQKKQWEKEFKYGKKLNFIDRDTEQSHFVLAWPALNRFDERDQVLSVLQTILGGNMSSRLFSEVRERRGLCYYVHSTSEAFCDCGSFGAAAGINPDKLEEAVKVTVNEFIQIAEQKKPITATELNKAKNYLVGQLTLGAESVFNLALNYGMQYLFEQRIRTVSEQMARIKAVTLDQVHELAKEIIVPGQLRFGAIGKISDKQKNTIEKLVLGK